MEFLSNPCIVLQIAGTAIVLALAVIVLVKLRRNKG